MSNDMDRTQGIGGSDLPAIFGISPYATPRSLYLQKRGELKDETQWEAAHWGHALEDVILRHYATVVVQQELGDSAYVYKPGEFTAGEGQWMRGRPDALVCKFNDEAKSILWGVEVKNRSAWKAGEWGEMGTDDVPESVKMQCQWYMRLTGARRWDVAVLIGGNTFKWYALYYDAEYADKLVDKAREFWFDHVQRGIAPDPLTPEEVYAMFPNAEKQGIVADASDELMVQAYENLSQEIRKLTEERAGWEQKIKFRMGKAETLENEHVTVRWSNVKGRAKLDADALVKAHAQAVELDEAWVREQFSVQGKPYRRFSVKVHDSDEGETDDNG